MTESKTVVQALADVMSDVQSVGKRERNASQGFNFRGIDSVVNAVGPVLRQHGVIFVPNASSLTGETYQTAKGTTMKNVVVKVDWHIFGPAGDHITASTYGEASDSGDKSVSKAHSVAYRTALLQTLCIPTDDPDPDASVHERGQQTGRSVGPPPELAMARADVYNAATKAKPDMSQDELNAWIRAELNARHLNGGNADDLRKFAAELVQS